VGDDTDEDDGDLVRECDVCGGGAIEEMLLARALEYREKGWELERTYSSFCGMWTTCESCGRGVDDEEAVHAYETGEMPAVSDDGGAEEDEDAECEFCTGIEESLIETALEHRVNGWKLDWNDDRFGTTYLWCESCGGRSDDTDAIRAYETGVTPNE
jgi:hypothetical protein